MTWRFESGQRDSLQLDVFRGLAAVLMVFNHAGFAWLAPQDSQLGGSAVPVFVGSFAPVLFFFATGLGLGWTGNRQPLQRSLWHKVGLLFWADMLLSWSHGRPWGLDFFGFIALSMVIVAVVRSTSAPGRWVWAGIAALLLLRFGLSPWLLHTAQQSVPVAFVTGLVAVHSVSYPLSPWLVYALLGWWVGAHSTARFDLRLAGIAGACVVTAAGMSVLGMSFHRWGTVAAGFWVLSLGVLGCAWWLAGGLVVWAPRLATGLALRGPASLLMVPLHYLLLQLTELTGGLVLSPPVWAVSCVLLCGLVLLGSRALAAHLSRWHVPAWTVWSLLLLLSVATAGCYRWLAPMAWPTWVLAYITQMVIAWLLSLKVTQR